MKIDSLKKTFQSFASGVDDNRSRRDYTIRQTVNGVVFDVLNCNMQDEDYSINTEMVKLRTVSDKFCFFKSLLNVVKLPADE